MYHVRLRSSLLISLITLLLAATPLPTNAFNLSLSFSKADKGKSSLAKDDPLYQIKTVVIDAGHGGRDPGCSGSHTREKDIALAIALQLAENMRTQYPEVKVILTRDKDVFIPLHERAAIANRNQADLFISIHCNYMPGSSATRGTETYVMGLHTAEHNLTVAKRENAAILLEQNYEINYDYDPNSPEGHIMLSMFQNAYLEQSIRFAQMVESHLHVQADRKSRGVKQAGFVVLKETAMPSVLIETGFLSSRTEEKWLNSEDGQQEAAGAILQAFEDYKYEIETGKVATPPVAKAILENENAEEVLAVKRTSLTETAPPVEDFAKEGFARPIAQPQTSSASSPANAYPAAEYAAPVASPTKIGGSPYPLRNASSPPTSTSPSSETRGKVIIQNRTAEHAVPHPKQDSPTYSSDRIYTESRLIQNQPSYTPTQPNTYTPPRPPIVTEDTPVGLPPTDALDPKGPVSPNSEEPIFFYVQLAASARPLDTSSGRWRNIAYQVEVVQEGNMYKYQARNFPDYYRADAARIDLKQLGFSDAWIVAYRNGKRIPTQEALQELNIN